MAKKNIVNFILAREFLASVGGEYAIGLVKICEKKKKAITDEEISKVLPLKITEIRAVLNRLHYRGIACYKKTRNTKTGWYSYTWTVEPKRIAELVLTQQAEELQKLENKIAYEKNYVFFTCTNKCDNHPFEIAAEYQFKCPECGETMNSISNKKRIRELKDKIKLINCEVVELQKMR